jgi:hypothetical protein
MNDFFVNCTAQHLLAVVGPVAATAAFIVLVITIYRYNMRSLADRTTLRRERQQADLLLRQELLKRDVPTEEMSHLLTLVTLPDPDAPFRPTLTPTEDTTVRVVSLIAGLAESAPPELVAETSELAAGADRSLQLVLVRMLEEMMENGVSGAVALVSVRSVCRAPRAPGLKQEAVQTQ